MTDFSGIRFFTTPSTVAVAILLVLATAAVSIVSWRRSGYAAGQGWLEALRLLIAAVVAVLLNQPEWVEERQPEGLPVVAVFHDASRSMDTTDVSTPRGGRMSRREAIATTATSTFWQPLEERFQVVVEPLSPAPPATGTDLATPLAEAADRLAALKKTDFRLRGRYGSLEQLQRQIEVQGVSPDDHGLYTDLLEWRATRYELSALVELLETL